MSCQRSFWFHVPLIKQLKQYNVAHREATINNVDTVKHCVGGHIRVSIETLGILKFFFFFFF